MPDLYALNCPSCAASLDYDGRSETIRCDYCGATIIVPKSLRGSEATPGFMGDEAPEMAYNVHEILQLLQAGRKIEAIKIYRETFDVSLKDAKKAVEHLQQGQPTATNTFSSHVVTTTAATTGNCNRFCLLTILLIILAAAALGLMIFLNVNPAGFERISRAVGTGGFSQAAEEVGAAISNRAVFGDPILLTAGGDGVGADLLLETWLYGGSEIPVRLAYTAVRDGRRQLIWETEIGTSGDHRFNAGFDAQTIYVARGSALRAYDRASGESLWETALSDEVNANCRNCIRTRQNKVVILTTDNTLEAFDADTGRSVWQQKLAKATFSYPEVGEAAFALVGERVAVLDEVMVDGRGETALLFYDIDTGELTQQIQPRCPDIENFFDDDTINRDSQLFLDETSGEMIILFGTAFVGQMCLQKWDADSGQLLLEARLPDSYAHSNNAPGGLITQWETYPYAYLTADQLVTALNVTDEANNSVQSAVVLDLSSGEIRLQATHEDYETAPIGDAAGTLLVWAERQRGTKQHEIWGVDITTGERRWQHIVQAEYLYALDPFDDRFSYRLEPEGVVLLQLLTDETPSQLLVQKLNPADGSLVYDTITPLSDDSWRGLTWTNGYAYLSVRDLVAVNLETGEAVTEWP